MKKLNKNYPQWMYIENVGGRTKQILLYILIEALPLLLQITVGTLFK